MRQNAHTDFWFDHFQLPLRAHTWWFCRGHDPSRLAEYELRTPLESVSTRFLILFFFYIKKNNFENVSPYPFNPPLLLSVAKQGGLVAKVSRPPPLPKKKSPPGGPKPPENVIFGRFRANQGNKGGQLIRGGQLLKLSLIFLQTKKTLFVQR